jgi:SOS-response transcriptional repressor LexA
MLHEQFAGTGRIPSVRELSRALGYQSSRSGHVLLHRLLSKGVLLRRAGQLEFAK